MPIFHRRLPTPLSALQDLALDLHWSWNHAGDWVWRNVNTEVWEHTRNPISVLQLTSDEKLDRLTFDLDFMQRLELLIQERKDYLTKPSWYSTHYLKSSENSYSAKPIRGIAYFSMEFGLCEALPLYAGGLGMLAGDFLKTASDLGVPLIGIGLLYQQGYFRQNIASDGWQQETYLFNDPGNLPVEPLRAKDGSWLHIDTNFLCRPVRFRVWHAQVGKVTLYLLDSNDPSNQSCDRDITSKLYGGNLELRLMQELALGICGWRLIETLELDIDICHLNEGHAAFATLERINAYRQRHQIDFEAALWATRSGNIFTTHTAVAAGFDVYPENLVRPYIAELAFQLNVDADVILALGHATPTSLHTQHQTQIPASKDEPKNFNMAFLALHTCGQANAVSQLHGVVSRRIFQPLFPRWPEREVPIGHVTNGVHIPSWDSPWADTEWTKLFGKDRWRGDVNALPAKPLERLSDTQLWEMAKQERAHLVDYVRQRLTHQWRNESTPPSCAITNILPLDPNILTLGFARRFAEYKRADLLLRDPERLARLLCNNQHPVQLIVAGKAHPADDAGKQALQRWYQFIQRPDVGEHVVFIQDYDISLAQELVQGVDVWINTPRRPWEACGTSGMKVLVNGGLNISTLDGWWAEAFESDLGWAIGDISDSGTKNNYNIQNDQDDARDAEQLYQLLEQKVAPLFYQRNEQGLPLVWLTYMRASMAKLTPRFSSNRMMTDYLTYYYLPAAANLKARQENNAEIAKELQGWQDNLRLHWHEIHVGELNIEPHTENNKIEVTVYLGGISPDDVCVQMIADQRQSQAALTLNLKLINSISGAINAYRYQGALPNYREPKDFTLRVISAHPHAIIPAESALIYWQPRDEF